jgi:uncharacterized protein (UPF0335 family)
MSQLGITTDLLINRTSWTAELRAAENDVKSLAQRLAASPLKIPAVLSIDATKLRAAIAAAQTIANANPITIPVTYGAPGGGFSPAPLVTPGGGGGGYPTGGGGTNYLTGGAGAGLGGSPATRANFAQGSGLGGGGRGYGGMAMRGLAFYAAHKGVQELEHVIGDMSTLSDLGNDVNSSNLAQTAKHVRKIAEDENSGTLGFFRRNSAIYHAMYGSPDDQVAGINQTLGDAERGERRVANTDKGLSRLREAGNRITAAAQGGSAARLAELEQWQAQEEKLANDLRAEGQKKLGDRLSAATGVMVAIERTRIARAEVAAESQSALRIQGMSDRAGEAEMRSQGRGTEAAYTGRRREIDERLTRLGIAYQAESDPVRRAQLGREYQAELNAGTREAGALNAGMARDTQQDVNAAQRRGRIADLEAAGQGRQATIYAQTSAIDERLRRQREEADATQNPVVRANLQRRLGADTTAGEKEKAAIIVEDWRRTLDAIAGYTIQKDQAILATTKNDGQAQLRIFDETTARLRERMKDRNQKEREVFEEARSEGRKALESEQQEQHMSMRQQARDILLQYRGKGGLASELDIEDEFRRNVKAAGTDSRAQHDAQELTKARLEAFIRGSWQPQIFNSWAGFDQAAQMNLINRDAQGLKRAVNLRNALNGFQGGGWDLSAAGGGAEGFGPEDVQKFADASDKLSDAADKLGQNTLAVVKF